MRNLLTIALAVFLTVPALADQLSVPARVEAAMFGEHRSERSTARNKFRHPVGTLEFFGLSDGMTVLEIGPSGGWYTEILAPVMRDHGKLVLANWDANVEGQPSYRYELPKRLAKTFAAHPDVYDQVESIPFSPPQSASLGAADSYDMVLTFRSTHGWVREGIAADIYKEFARVLKPGGVLGVVQHRAPDNSKESAKAWAENGYVPTAEVVRLAERAGLILEASSPVNANPADTKDHPEGVWTLPPGLELGDKDKDKYLKIGESDRMTLRFRKPANG